MRKRIHNNSPDAREKKGIYYNLEIVFEKLASESRGENYAPPIYLSASQSHRD